MNHFKNFLLLILGALFLAPNLSEARWQSPDQARSYRRSSRTPSSYRRPAANRRRRPASRVRQRRMAYRMVEHEIYGGSNVAANLVLSPSTSKSTVFNIGVGYLYQISHGFQLGVEFENVFDKDAVAPNQKNKFDAGLVFAVNFPMNGMLMDNFFVALKGKFKKDANTNFGVGFEAGYRMKLARHVAWRPSVEVSKYLKQGKDLSVNLNIVALSAVF